MTTQTAMITDYFLKGLIALAIGACGLVMSDMRQGVQDVRNAQVTNQLSTVDKLARIETQVAGAASNAESTNREIRVLQDRINALEQRSGGR